MEKIYLTSDIGKGNSIICKVSLILMKSFMQKCLVGSAMLSEIDDYKDHDEKISISQHGDKYYYKKYKIGF